MHDGVPPSIEPLVFPCRLVHLHLPQAPSDFTSPALVPLLVHLTHPFFRVPCFVGSSFGCFSLRLSQGTRMGMRRMVIGTRTGTRAVSWMGTGTGTGTGARKGLPLLYLLRFCFEHIGTIALDARPVGSSVPNRSVWRVTLEHIVQLAVVWDQAIKWFFLIAANDFLFV